VAWGCHEVDAGSYTASEDVSRLLRLRLGHDCAADGSVTWRG